MLIAVDIDAVLADFLSVFLKYRNDLYGTNWKRDQFYTYIWSIVFNESKEEMYSILSDFFHSDYIRRIKPMPGAVAGVGILAEKHRIDVVTSRPRIIASLTQDWLDKYFPNKFERVFYSNQAAYGSFGSTKGEICDKVGADLFIDDQSDYCEESAQEGIEVFLFDNPWNREVELKPHITRVYSWPEIVKEVALRENNNNK